MNRIIAFLAGLLIAVSSAYAAKLPDETALGGAPASNDLIRMVDVSDHTQSGQGTTKRMTIADLFTSPTINNSLLITDSAGAHSPAGVTLGIGGTTTGWYDGGYITFASGGSARWAFSQSEWRSNNGCVTFAPGDPNSFYPDVGICRAGTGLLDVDNGTSGSYAGTAIKTGPQTVSQLRTCNSGATGARAYVTDSTAAYSGASLGSAVSGGGSSKAPVICDGTNWTIGG